MLDQRLAPRAVSQVRKAAHNWARPLPGRPELPATRAAAPGYDALRSTDVGSPSHPAERPIQRRATGLAPRRARAAVHRVVSQPRRREGLTSPPPRVGISGMFNFARHTKCPIVL